MKTNWSAYSKYIISMLLQGCNIFFMLFMLMFISKLAGRVLKCVLYSPSRATSQWAPQCRRTWGYHWSALPEESRQVE